MANRTELNETLGAGSPSSRLVGLIPAAFLEVVTLLGNGTVLAVVLRTPALRKAIYLAHLCLVDLLAAVSVMPLGLLAAPPGLGTVYLSRGQCRAARFVTTTLVSACTLTLAALGLERYRYILHPLRPRPRPPPILVLGIVWGVSGLLGGLSLLGRPSPNCSLVAGPPGPFRPLWAILAFALPALLLLVSYGSIFRVARLAALRPPPPAPGPRPRSDSLDSHLSILPPRLASPHLVGGKAALTLALVVGQFLGCWLPFFAACLLPGRWSIGIEVALTWLAYSSFAAHPFLYGLLQRPVREELSRLARAWLQAVPGPWHCPPGTWLPQSFLKLLRGDPESPALDPSAGQEANTMTAEGPGLDPGETT
ncbi:G-protein coupled receptor 62 [Phascolarctos cinereus]|uniref:Probable G-protein coupled receptor 62 n=1 Tax=Phascolarctos cinereus TaxID=38626 RepID=A0A6P5LCW9_PHACI|nr:probable G-protein coupled receptor 62 [Phascolarctos cinereus]